MTIKIDAEELKEKLIKIYSYYISDDKKLKKKAKEMAMDLDGLWAGSFLFSKAIENAIGGLTYLYVEPKISKQEAKKILKDLENDKP
jgi:hypothetical protein